MPSEMWSKIQAASDAINHQEALRHQIKPPRYQVPTLPSISKETLKHRYRDPFLKIIRPIIEDIRSNHPPIVKANQSDILEIDVISSSVPTDLLFHLDQFIFEPTKTPNLLVLRWGNKLGPNEEELSLLKTDKKPMFHPSEIVLGDYEYIYFEIKDRILAGPEYDFLEIDSHTYKLDELSKDPSIVAPAIAERLRKLKFPPNIFNIIYHYHRVKPGHYGRSNWHHPHDSHELITYSNDKTPEHN